MRQISFFIITKSNFFLLFICSSSRKIGRPVAAKKDTVPQHGLLENMDWLKLYKASFDYNWGGQVISIPGVDSSPSDASPQPAAPARAARVAAHYSIKLNFVARNINAVLRIQNF